MKVHELIRFLSYFPYESEVVVECGEYKNQLTNRVQKVGWWSKKENQVVVSGRKD